MKLKLVSLVAFLIIAVISKAQNNLERTKNFPLYREQVKQLPDKSHFYIYIIAGQSNAAGRGLVEPSDTIANKNVLTIDKDNNWVYAKEPLHFNDPAMTGLDFGLSFGNTISKLYGDKIFIGVIPCAVGGSSIEQWLGDSTHRGIKLYSNLLEKIKFASNYGTIKGILWHQGENNATVTGYVDYKNKLQSFFSKLRADVNIPDLPVYAGQLSSFHETTEYKNYKALNNDLETLSKTFKNFYVVPTTDLNHKGDILHYDSKSLRIMGGRYAAKAYETNKKRILP